MSEIPQTDVVIVGGGPVGMALAIELGQRNVETTVIERHAKPQPIPKGQNLTQRTMEHFHAWGIEAELRAAATIPDAAGIGGLTAYRTLLSGHHYDWLKRGLINDFYSRKNERLPQYATEAVLRARAAQLPSVALRYGSTVTDTAVGEGLTRVTAIDAAGSKTSVTARYVVGCDGSRSTIRIVAGITQTFSDHDRLMALLVFRSAALGKLLERFSGKLYFNVLHPSQRGYWLFLGRVDMDDRWFFHAPVPPEARDGGTDFAALLHQAVGAPFDVEMEHIGFWDLRFAIADTYGRNSLFVAGDAAHSHPPYGGYGINTGFEDARNLGWKLAASLEGWAGPNLLPSYHSERHAVFASTSKDFIEKSIADDRRFLDAHDPLIDRARFEAAWAKRAKGAADEVDRYEPHYAGSPIVFGDEGARSGAVGRHLFLAAGGHHLAPGMLPSGSHIHDVLGNGFTLLAFVEPTTASNAFSAIAEELGIPLAVVWEESPELATHYGAELVLVRPDGFVAWAGNSTSKVTPDILRRCAGY